jgi:hypothetical protein
MHPKQEALSTATLQSLKSNGRNLTTKRPTAVAEEVQLEEASAPECENDHSLFTAFYYWVNSRP